MESFLARLQDKVIVEGREDKVLGGIEECNVLC